MSKYSIQGPEFNHQRSSTQSCCLCYLSDLQGQAGPEADGQGSEISLHAAVSCGWPRSCVAGRWQSVLSEQSARSLLFGFGCAGAWQEQLGLCTGFPLFMWGPGISTPAHCCAGGAAPTATYCTIKSVEGHGEGEGRGWMGGLSCQESWKTAMILYCERKHAEHSIYTHLKTVITGLWRQRSKL